METIDSQVKKKKNQTTLVFKIVPNVQYKI